VIPTELPERPFDLAVWWFMYGRELSIVLALALAMAAIAAWAGRRMYPPTAGEPRHRALLRDASILGVSVLLTGSGLLTGGVAASLYRLGVMSFFLPCGVGFYATGVILPSVLLASALRGRSLPRAVLAALPLSVAILMLTVEPNRLEVHRRSLVIPSLPPGTEIRVAHLSDLQTIGLSGRDRRAALAVAEFDPDLVAFTGDLIAWDPHETVRAEVRSWLSGLRSRTSRFVVNGDSDADFDRVVEDLEGITYLRDRGVDIEIRGARLHVAGVDNVARPWRPELALAAAPPGATTILLAHNPDVFAEPGSWHADLGLAGHTHGGQIHLPGFGALITFTRIGRRYSDGVFTGLSAARDFPWRVDALSVCAGLGMEGGYAPRVRLLRPPQVMLLTLLGNRA
jgi:uncharacterized protein